MSETSRSGQPNDSRNDSIGAIWRNGLKLFRRRGHREKLKHFLGRRVASLSALSLLCAFALFVAEFAFAFAMQILLSSLGFVSLARAGRFGGAIKLQYALIVLIFVVLFRAFFQWLQIYVQNVGCFVFASLLRKRILRWAFASPTLRTTEIIPLFGDRSVFASLMLLHIQQLGFFLLILILLACALVWLAPLPTMIAFACLGALGWPLHRFARVAHANGAGIGDAKSALDRRFYKDLRVFLFLKIYSKEKEEREALERGLDDIDNRNARFYGLSGAASTIPQALGACVLAAVIYSLHGTDRSAFLVPYLYLFFRFTQNASQIAFHYANVLFHAPAFFEMAAWWTKHSHDRPGARAAQINQRETPVQPLGWDARDLEFRYPESTEPAVATSALRIAPRTCVAIIGASGAGKSTLIGLLLDQLQPQTGSIDLIDEAGNAYPLASHRESFLQRIGYVGPEPFLFEGTVRENLAFGLPQAPTAAALESVLREAECQFVWDAPKGLDHFLTDQGAGLSAGQKQRLALARALLRRPSVLLLDEATSNLDARTEAALIDTLKTYKGEMTMLIVTHRESMLKLADRTLTMDGGALRDDASGGAAGSQRLGGMPAMT